MGAGADDELATDDEKPAHTVNLDGFWIMRTEVTNAQYARCVRLARAVHPTMTAGSSPTLQNTL